jgi:hypothetical protein
VPRGRGRPEFRWLWEKPMELEDLRVGTRAGMRPGTRVRVGVDYRKPHRRGAIGTIKKHYGSGEYTAFEVSFPDGQAELFWDHQLEEAEEFSPRAKKRWWVLW